MRKIGPDDLLKLALVGDPQLSPDGRRVAYVALRLDPEKNEIRRQIFMMNAAPGARPLPFTAGPKSDQHPRWSPDGNKLAFLSDRSGKNQLWVMDAAGGEARQLTRFKEGVGGAPVWSPDGSQIAFTAAVGPEGPGREGDKDDESDLFKKYTKGVKRITSLWYKQDGEGFLDREKPDQIFTIAVDDEEPEARQVTHGPWSHGAPAWSPDGRAMLFVASRREDADYTPHLQDVYLQELAGPGAPVCLTPGNFYVSCPIFSPDGSHIAFAGHPWEPRRAYSVIHLFVMVRDGSDLRQVDAGWDRPFAPEVVTDMPGPGGGVKLTWTPDGTALVALTSDQGRQQVAAVDVASGSLTMLTQGDHCVTSWSYDSRCRKLAVAVTRPDLPADLFLVEGPDLLPLTNINDPVLSDLELAPVEPFTFATADGSNAFLVKHGRVEPEETEGWVMRPVDFDPAQRYPAVLEVHGGPMAMYGWAFMMEFQCLAAAGYAVVYTNPRGSQGYGQEFCACIEADWGNLDYLDVMAGLDAALARFPWLDSERLGIAGGSYGGFMTNWAVGHTNRFKAAVTMRSVVNEASSVGTSDYGFLDMAAYPNRPWESMDFYRQVSPLTFVDRIRTPLLIEHQEEDQRCPIEQAEQLYTALKVLHRTVEFVRYPESSHGMSRTGKPWLRVYRLRTILDWFARYNPVQ